MTKGAHIRIADIGDAPILCHAERAIARTPGRLISKPEELVELAFEKKIEFLKRAGRYLVAEIDSKVVGHALLEPMAPLKALKHVFTLTVVVHEGYAGQRVGSKLMHSLLEWAHASPLVEKVELRVRESNHPALQLYRKFGFSEEGRFERRIRLDDGSYLADISMAWFPKRHLPFNSPLNGDPSGRLA
jgi:putative acetyltransferase